MALAAGDRLLALGTRAQLERVEHVLAGRRSWLRRPSRPRRPVGDATSRRRRRARRARRALRHRAGPGAL